MVSAIHFMAGQAGGSLSGAQLSGSITG